MHAGKDYEDTPESAFFTCGEHQNYLHLTATKQSNGHPVDIEMSST